MKEEIIWRNTTEELPEIGKPFTVIGLCWHGINQKHYIKEVHFDDSDNNFYQWERCAGEGIIQRPTIVDMWAYYPKAEKVWNKAGTI